MLLYSVTLFHCILEENIVLDYIYLQQEHLLETLRGTAHSPENCTPSLTFFFFLLADSYISWPAVSTGKNLKLTTAATLLLLGWVL